MREAATTGTELPTDAATLLDTLKRASALIRARAEAATPGPWVTTDLGHIVRADAGPGRRSFIRAEWGPDAQHVVSWQPAAALAIADWLDTAAYLYQYGDDGGPRLRDHALAVARAYLKEQS